MIKTKNKTNLFAVFITVLMLTTAIFGYLFYETRTNYTEYKEQTSITLDSNTLEIENLNTELTTSKNQVEILNTEKTTLQTELTAKQNALIAKTAELEAKTAELEEYQAELEQLKVDVSSNTEQIEELTTKINETEMGIVRINEEIDSLDTNIVDIYERLDGIDIRTNEINSNISEILSRLQALENNTTSQGLTTINLNDMSWDERIDIIAKTALEQPKMRVMLTPTEDINNTYTIHNFIYNSDGTITHSTRNVTTSVLSTYEGTLYFDLVSISVKQSRRVQVTFSSPIMFYGSNKSNLINFDVSYKNSDLSEFMPGRMAVMRSINISEGMFYISDLTMDNVSIDKINMSIIY